MKQKLLILAKHPVTSFVTFVALLFVLIALTLHITIQAPPQTKPRFITVPSPVLVTLPPTNIPTINAAPTPTTAPNTATQHTSTTRRSTTPITHSNPQPAPAPPKPTPPGQHKGIIKQTLSLIGL